MTRPPVGYLPGSRWLIAGDAALVYMDGDAADAMAWWPAVRAGEPAAELIARVLGDGVLGSRTPLAMVHAEDGSAAVRLLVQGDLQVTVETVAGQQVVVSGADKITWSEEVVADAVAVEIGGHGLANADLLPMPAGVVQAGQVRWQLDPSATTGSGVHAPRVTDQARPVPVGSSGLQPAPENLVTPIGALSAVLPPVGDPVLDEPVSDDPVLDDSVLEDQVLDDQVHDDALPEDSVSDDPAIGGPALDPAVLDGQELDGGAGDESAVAASVSDEPAAAEMSQPVPIAHTDNGVLDAIVIGDLGQETSEVADLGPEGDEAATVISAVPVPVVGSQPPDVEFAEPGTDHPTELVAPAPADPAASDDGEQGPAVGAPDAGADPDGQPTAVIPDPDAAPTELMPAGPTAVPAAHQVPALAAAALAALAAGRQRAEANESAGPAEPTSPPTLPTADSTQQVPQDDLDDLVAAELANSSAAYGAADESDDDVDVRPAPGVGVDSPDVDQESPSAASVFDQPPAVAKAVDSLDSAALAADSIPTGDPGLVQPQLVDDVPAVEVSGFPPIGQLNPFPSVALPPFSPPPFTPPPFTPPPFTPPAATAPPAPPPFVPLPTVLPPAVPVAQVPVVQVPGAQAPAVSSPGGVATATVVGDHDGQTELAGPIAGPIDPAAAASVPTGQVYASMCPQGHASAPHSSDCRVCGAAIASGAPVLAPRPLLGRIRLSTGPTVDLDRRVVIGRAPAVSRVASSDMPHLVSVPSPHQDISRSHVEVRTEDWHLVVADLNSTNGTVVRAPGRPEQLLHPGQTVVVETGWTVDLGDGVSFVVERTG